MELHYFQRYHKKEDVDTSNTMLMLSRLYNYNAGKFFSMLNELIFCEDETPEIKFDLQVAQKDSVADATISQTSFKIVVETKLYNQFDYDQLERHLIHFSTEKIKVLLTIDPRPMNRDLKEKFDKHLEHYNKENISRINSYIKHVNLTFEQLINAMESVVDERDVEILSVLDDFKNYCLEEGLLPNDDKWMRALASGETFDDNIKYKLYYKPASKGHSSHGYIGLYQNKCVRYIGKLKKTVIADMIDGKLNIKNEGDEIATNEEMSLIEAAIIHAKEAYGYDLKSEQHRFFLVDEFYPTDFKKVSKGPMLSNRYFNLSTILGVDKLPSTEQIANDLRGKTWE